MTKLRLVLLATTALTALQFAAAPSHAQAAPLVVAQAKEEVGPDGKPTGTRSDFVRGPDGNVAWFRNHGRLYTKQ